MEGTEEKHIDDNSAPSSAIDAVKDDENKSDISALRENIISKGQNSYYYAHERKIDAPVWDGNAEPRLLRKQTSQSQNRIPQNITNYAWSDDTSKVKIYISMDGIGELSDDDIELNWSEEMISILIRNFNEKDYGLHISNLNNKITNATYKKKPNKIILTLTKDLEVSWHDLKKN
mmetsp:Transcript_18122/g.23846  ORF Transcript_18122/g.23846 Transcript_18122/m.23846 type:complete len:175 (-) Transcript_18122:194-718(-)|eukprot:CAMPEP_0117759716 /NCGR_PEP_ID=MMETSP0947-20121206/16176_1 /TAXON_ID=44440 /ORGANISM="Chattonella subsalsa, Strain CCMP2191" /LENGTH=174 /DNA_ID=CAMNT_0005580221 /DNA_START=199 /DNA_END=723 /DNA_ORIENTATION=-